MGGESVPYPLGASWDPQGCNFAVFAGHAEQLDLCLFDAHGRNEVRRVIMPECTDGVWHIHVPGVQPGQLYGYRAHGPYDPEQGHRYNANKLLLDPHARALAGSVRWSDALYGYRITSPRGDLSFDRRDSAFAMPKAVVTAESFDWGDARPPPTPWGDTVIYETHLRRLTMPHGAGPARMRATSGAFAHGDLIRHLTRLGVT